MLPLSAVDLRIDPSPLPFEERRIVCRSAPERLRFETPPLGTVVLTPQAHPPAPLREGGGLVRRLAGLLRLAAPA